MRRIQIMLQEGLISLQMDRQGQQLLRLFHVDGLVLFEKRQFAAEEALLAEYRELRRLEGGGE